MSAPDATVPGALEPGTIERRVDAGDCVHRGGYDVLATPSVVRLLEEAAMVAVEPLLASGQSSVGSTVVVDEDDFGTRLAQKAERATAAEE